MSLRFGKLAMSMGRPLPLTICTSANGHYIGTLDDDGMPYSRESLEYWATHQEAMSAFKTENWTQREHP